jgi:hypothetical protein
METNRNCISYWLPKLEAFGLPVPRTEVVRTGRDLVRLFDDETPDGWADFLDRLGRACARAGSPCFLRTGQTAGKQSWKKTCFVADAGPAGLAAHVTALVEYSEMADFLGLATDVWAARELLPTRPLAVLGRYGDMPLVREVRCFVRHAEVVCLHPYWPAGAILEGLEEGASTLEAEALEMRAGLLRPYEVEAVNDLASRAGAAVGGEWSVDVLDTARGWHVTDMAEAARSFHWPGCPRAGVFG